MNLGSSYDQNLLPEFNILANTAWPHVDHSYKVLEQIATLNQIALRGRSRLSVEGGGGGGGGGGQPSYFKSRGA